MSMTPTLTRALTSLSVALAACSAMVGCQQASPMTAPAAALAKPAAAKAQADGPKRLPFELTPEQAQRLQEHMKLPPDVVAKLKGIQDSVGGDSSKLSEGQKEEIHRTLLASTSARFFGISGGGEFTGEGGDTALGNHRYMFKVPKGRVLLITQVQNPHMISINGFTLADQSNSFNLNVNADSSSQCQQNNYYWWYWYYDSCGGGGYGYWYWWYWYYGYGWGGNNNQQNSDSAQATNNQYIYDANYMFGADEPVVFGSVVMNDWRASGYTVPESYIAGVALAK